MEMIEPNLKDLFCCWQVVDDDQVERVTPGQAHPQEHSIEIFVWVETLKTKNLKK
jgi:hypothetical protein